MGAVWVLCGALASGKSTVAGYFAEAGAEVLDADAVVAGLLEDDSGVRKLMEEAFGPGILGRDDRPDRGILAERAFADPAFRRTLESILHPRVLASLGDRASRFRKEPGGLLILEIVLWMRLDPAPFPVDGVCVTRAPVERLIERAVGRGLTKEEARARLRAQGAWEDWGSRADILLDTDCSMESLRETVLSYYRLWTRKGKGPDR